MSPFRLLPLAALMLTAGCAYDSYAQGYAPPGAYDQGYGQEGYGQGGGYDEVNVPSVEVFYDQLEP